MIFLHTPAFNDLREQIICEGSNADIGNVLSGYSVWGNRIPTQAGGKSCYFASPTASIDPHAGLDHGIGQFDPVASAQVEAFDKNSLTQAHGFEVGIDRKTGLLLKSGRRFELRLYPGDRADVGLRVMLKLDFSLRNSVEKIDDDVKVDQLDHVRTVTGGRSCEPNFKCFIHPTLRASLAAKPGHPVQVARAGIEPTVQNQCQPGESPAQASG